MPLLSAATLVLVSLLEITPASGQSTDWFDEIVSYDTCPTSLQCTDCAPRSPPAPTETPYNCSIKMQSYSGYAEACQPNRSLPGYVELKGRRFWTSGWCDPTLPNPRGVNTLIVDPNKCTPFDFRNFDTHLSADNAQDLVEYLSVVHQGALIVSFTADEPTRNLGPALRRLRAFGVRIDDVAHRGNFAFIIQIGYPWKTSYVRADSKQLNVQLQVTVSGSGVNNLQITRV